MRVDELIELLKGYPGNCQTDIIRENILHNVRQGWDGLSETSINLKPEEKCGIPFPMGGYRVVEERDYPATIALTRFPCSND